MDDRFIKYTKLYFLIVGAFLFVQLLLAVVLSVLWGFVSILSSRPLNIFFELLVMALPPVLFAGVYFIFIRRTKKHSSQFVKAISQVLMIVAFCACMYVLVTDLINYVDLKFGAWEISSFKSYSLLFLAGNIALMFAIAMLQAFTAPKEEDWMQKRSRSE